MKYMKQLDALRALAVTGVLYHHWINSKTDPIPIFKHSINWGLIGVDLFYVLSGFLITGILLKSKQQITTGKQTIYSCLKTFFVRRILRIFPIYYLTLAVAYLLSITPVPETIWWHLCYASNIYIAQRGDWPGTISHLWSLAVEEQFYLIWPWIILLIPEKMLFSVLIFIISLGPIFRHICDILDVGEISKVVITIGNMDLFGIGALLAYLISHNLVNSYKSQCYLKLCLIVGGIMFTESLLLRSFGINNSLSNFSRTFEGLFICYVIYRTSIGFKGLMGRILEFKPLLYLGKISYGIYLYHSFIKSVAPNMLNALSISMPSTIGGQFVVFASLTIITASLSWYIIEKPINILKSKYT